MTEKSIAEIEYTMQRVKGRTAVLILTAKLAQAFLNTLPKEDKKMDFEIEWT